MKEALRTEDLYIEVSKRENGTHVLNIYNTQDEYTFVEAYLSDREMCALIKMLTRVNIGLKPY